MPVMALADRLAQHLDDDPNQYLSAREASFFNYTAPTEIYTLSLHDALPISERLDHVLLVLGDDEHDRRGLAPGGEELRRRSEEHTSELQSHDNLVCRLL